MITIRCRLYFKCDNINGVYGFGETFAKFNLLRHRVEVWVQEHVPFRHIIKKAPVYLSVYENTTIKIRKVFFIHGTATFITSNRAFVHVNTDTYCVFDFRRPHRWGIEVWGTDFDIVIAGSMNYEHLMNKMTSILGRMPKVPEWIYNGVILGIQDGCERCDEKLNVMLDNDVKVSGIWAQDWEGQRITGFGKQLFWDWMADEKLYGKLEEYIAKWDEKGVKFLGYINPFLATEGKLYKEALANGYLVLDELGDPYLVKITTFKAAMIDLSNPETCTWIKEVIKKNMIGIGLKGWMADFGEYLPTDAVIKNGDPMNLHNQWPVLWAKVNREAVEEAGMEDEIFFFTRAGSTGTGKYTSMMWNGDQHVDWSRDYGIASIVNSQLSLSVSGIGASHSDIGGYTTFGKVRRSKELMLRWLEMSAFSPAMRTHEGNRPDSNIHFHSDMDIINAFAKFSNIFVNISPYIKECVDMASETGMPAIRPVFFHFEHDDRLFDVDDTYMLGRISWLVRWLKDGRLKESHYPK